MKTELVVNQEELKIVRLSNSVVQEDEQDIQTIHVNYLIDIYTKLLVGALSWVVVVVEKKAAYVCRFALIRVFYFPVDTLVS